MEQKQPNERRNFGNDIRSFVKHSFLKSNLSYPAKTPYYDETPIANQIYFPIYNWFVAGAVYKMVGRTVASSEGRVYLSRCLLLNQTYGFRFYVCRVLLSCCETAITALFVFDREYSKALTNGFKIIREGYFFDFIVIIT
jgi:hypothetical protein